MIFVLMSGKLAASQCRQVEVLLAIRSRFYAQCPLEDSPEAMERVRRKFIGNFGAER